MEQEISLEEEYGESGYAWICIVGGVVIGVAGLGFFLSRKTQAVRDEESTRFQMPEKITPYWVC